MMIEIGSLRKAVYDFTPENKQQELVLEVGDIVQVLKLEDKQWCSGLINGKEGNFPINFTIDLKIPHLEENQELFAPITTFTALEDGDLSFNKGDLIIGIRAIDENWWEGKCNDKQGIFPTNYVWKIDRSRLMKANAPRKVFKKARVTMNLKAQLKEEIDLVKDDIVTITEEIDKLWFKGERNGKTGIFPSSYVTVISEGECDDVTVSSEQDEPMSDVGFRAVHPDPVPDVTVSPSDVDHASNQCGYDCVSSGIAAYGQALYTFESQVDTDLSFREGELINLIRYVNDKWMVGEISGKTGMFPRNYVNVIVDCPSSDLGDTNLSSDPHGHILPRSYLQDQGEVISEEMDSLPPSYEDVIDSDSRLKFPSHNSVHVSSARSDRPLSYPSATFCKAPSSTNQSHFSFKSVPNIDDKIGENLSSLNSLFSSNAADSTSTSHRSLSFNEPSLSSQSTKPEDRIERPALQPSTYENVGASHLGSSNRISNDSHSNDTHVNSMTAECSGREAGTSNRSGDEAKRRAEERMKKMREQRNCIITEIFQTERDYKSDLEILYDIFVKDSQQGKAVGVDVAAIFGNLDEVIDISKQLIRRLEKVAKDSYENQMIGQCFIDISEDMKEVYGHYCRNHDEVNAVLDKYEEKPVANQYLKHKVEMMKRQTNCFDLPSMVIKPVQRILKYPLLLNELVKCTEDGHVDKQSLIEAISLMTDVATAINEFKRRKDLVFKYRKHADTSFSERISKLNIHSVLKKSSRFGMRLSNTIGLTHVTKDENFLKLECQFRTLEKSIKIFIKDINTYMEKTEELVKTAFQMAEDIAELYGEKKTQQEIDVFRSVHRIIATQYWETNKQVLDRNVFQVLKQLLRAFQGPNNLIQKRADKLLDYDACSNKLEKNRDGTKVKMLQDNLQVAKNTYEALNSQLLDDLPKLYSISVSILQDCIFCFIKSKKNFIGRSAKEMLTLTELPLLLGSPGDILDTFQIKHTLVTDNLCSMNIVPKQFFSSSNTSTLKRNSSPAAGLSFGLSSQNKAQVQQSSSVLQQLKSTYSAEQLYTASQDYSAADIFDLSLSKGDLVGVVKEQDPMGNKLRWFVDKGGSKGFVPAKILKHYVPSPQLNAWNMHEEQAYTTVKKRPYSCYSTTSTNAPTGQQQDLFFDWKNNSLSQAQILDVNQLQAQQTLNESASARKSSPVLQPSLNFDLLEAGNKPNGVNSPSNSLLNSSDEQPHKYEEIDEILGLYNYVNEDTSEKNQSVTSSTPASLEEFDPYGPLREHAQLYDNVPSFQESTDSSAGHRYEEIADQPTEVQAVPDVAQYYFAMYDFSPTGVNQLEVGKGQVVRVINKWDLSQNVEWWLVEDRYGNQGYVPANYLNEYPLAS